MKPTININGKTEEATGGYENSQCENESTGLGKPRGNSQINGSYQVRPTTAHSSRQNSSRANIQHTDITTGKILERLEVIEQAFRVYIHGHQHQLETRLKESKELETVFDQQVQALKQEIYNLAEAEQSENISE
ncbi:MAG TPA: hypothetical protein VK203_10655 [Nostocaceae cyanobacterium]|nr:hypothetical protein [Nostocaceae cyanobacterium]